MKFQKTTTLIVLTLACSVPSWTAKAADEGVPNPNAAEITNAGDETALPTCVQRLCFCQRIEQSARPEVWPRRLSLCRRRGNWRLEPRLVVVPAVGPYTGNVTGARISKISPHGFRTTVVDNLPSSQTSADSGSLISGVADVAFIGNDLYAVLGGAGCSHGVPSRP